MADKVTEFRDTTDAKGAGAIQNTTTLLRKGIRKLLKTMGYNLPGKRQGASRGEARKCWWRAVIRITKRK